MTVNVPIEIPVSPYFNVDTIVSRINVYAKCLLDESVHRPVADAEHVACRHEILCGALSGRKSPDTLRKEYLAHKYSL